MLKAIFWDMDGTLVDSEPLWGVATMELSEKLGKALTPELLETTRGGSLPHTIEVCSHHAGVSLSEAEIATISSAQLDRVAELFGDKLVPRAGIRELLTQLSDEEIPMFVTTNTERRLADVSIDAVGREFFTDSVAGGEAGAYKPDPAMFLEAARRVGIDADEALVFEDSPAGMRGAVAAGCRVVGLPLEKHLPEVPAGVTLMQRLHGSREFAGVTAQDVHEWFDLIGQSK